MKNFTEKISRIEQSNSWQRTTKLRVVVHSSWQLLQAKPQRWPLSTQPQFLFCMLNPFFFILQYFLENATNVWKCAKFQYLNNREQILRRWTKIKKWTIFHIGLNFFKYILNIFVIHDKQFLSTHWTFSFWAINIFINLGQHS